MSAKLFQKETDMTNGSILKQILGFALPMIIGLLFQQLYNTADMIIVGQFAGKQALAAVGGTTTIINTLVGFCSGLATGAGVVVSQQFGKHDKEGVSKAVHSSIALCLLLCAVSTVIGVTLSKPMLLLMQTPADVIEPANEYLTIYFLGVSGLLMYNTLTGIMRAVGDSTRPVIFLLISSVINIGLDILFVAVFNMGAFGAGLATIISQFISAILALIVLMKTDADYKVNLSKIRWDKDMISEIWRIGFPGGIQMAITSFSNTFVHSYINVYGTDAMTGYSVHMKLDSFIMVVTQAFSLATTTFVGQNYGAGRYKRATKGVKISLIFSIMVCIFLSALFIVFAPQLASLFNPDVGVINMTVFFTRLTVPFYFISCFNQNYAGALRGAGRSKTPMYILLATFVGFRQLYLFVVSKIFVGNILPVTLCIPVAWAVCGIVMGIAYYRSPIFKDAKEELPLDALDPFYEKANV